MYEPRELSSKLNPELLKEFLANQSQWETRSSMKTPAPLTGDMQWCRCHPCLSRTLLWEEEVHRTHGVNECIGWLTLCHVADTIHNERGHSDPKLVVRYTDLTVPKEKRTPGSWIHDVTDTELGQWVICAWKALNPQWYNCPQLTSNGSIQSASSSGKT